MAVVGLQWRTECSPELRRALRLLDIAAVLTAWAATLMLPDGIRALSVEHTARLVALAVVVIFATQSAIASQGLYLARVCSVQAVELARLARVAVVSALVAVAGGRIFGVDVSPLEALLGFLMTTTLLIAGRYGFRSWLEANRLKGRFSRSVVLVGSNEEALELCQLVREHGECGFRIRGVVGERADVTRLGFDVPWLAGFDRAIDAVRDSEAGGVLIAVTALPVGELNRLVRALLAEGVHVQLSSGLRGIAHERVRFQPLANEPLLYVEQPRFSASQVALKRALDFCLAAGGLLVALPVLSGAALAIKLDDRGPILFRQRRIGRDGNPFTIFKLRTMVRDAERRLDQVVDLNERQGGPLFKSDHDPRVTRIGRFLRATAIDELPQLFNVLRGEMSLVGPRPALPEEVAEFDAHVLARQTVPPGITGLWQVQAGRNPSFFAYQHLDLFYVENWSVTLDLMILLSTAGLVLFRACSALRPETVGPAGETGQALAASD
jgi:exopolysaccharide biosynthesis polyprenyl glycosylphosphotransferase